ncbi:nuclear transport factor 2 family protein [Mycobacterium sp. CPCC 205372]|uniref:Nuclear transport factor 2 family protein n=1 Tax=Mycobacterium hippophais TaxID=3016340 RepID=A0ABT4PZP0_9MYCO|nr:nuclear transport factor 2 family protein [Mycobacterium hippophais]MCZ8381995.1 nuclear transport factor 2 family protein [Mycobacterium hippophais]
MTQHSTDHPDIARNDLPAAVAAYLTAHRDGDAATALATFTTDAVVTDEGHTYRTRAAVGNWLTSAGSEYTYTTEYRGATATAAGVDVVQHLEGDFPGGSADLHYRFTLDGGSISRLTIEP